MPIKRRDLIKLAGASVGLCAVASRSWAQARWASDPFPMGVASGSPTATGIVLWTRLGPAALQAAGMQGRDVEVTWQIAHDERFSRIAAHGVIAATPRLGHSVHAEVEGLDSGRDYFYRFLAGNAASVTGRTRTFPAPDALPARLRLAYASCQQWGNGFYSAYRHMLDERLDVVLFLGDYIYEYPSSRPVDVRPTTGGWIMTLEGYRSRYELHKSDPDLRAIHAAVPWIVSWDDHEVQNDYAATHAGNSGPPVADFMARRHAAYQAYYEHMPLRRANFAALLDGTSANCTVSGATKFGQLATLYTLDGRQFRSPQACTSGNKPGSSRVDPATCPQWLDPKRTYLGNQQERWLETQFGRSATRWNTLGSPGMFGQRNFDLKGGMKLSNDDWDGYGPARQRVIDAMVSTKVQNPVIFGGDAHENWVGHVLRDYANPQSERVASEFCGTSITSLSGRAQERTEKLLSVNPHFIFANSVRRGYGVAEFTPQRLETTLRALNDAADPASGIFSLARFAVQSGNPTVHPITL